MTKKKEREEDVIEQKDIEKEVREEIETMGGEAESEAVGKKTRAKPVETAEKSADDKALADKYLNNWKRAVADLENYKKAQAKMLGEFRKYASLDMILQILPVLDNFNASLDHVPTDQKNNAWVTGITCIKKQLADVLKNNGVEEIEVKEGDEFNPSVHEAIDTKETNTDTKKTNKIMKVVRKGYKIDGKVIRAARVAVE